MLSFRNKLNSRDPEAIRKISASTGFFDATDIEISVNLAHSALDGQRHANDNVEEPSFLLAEDNGKTEGTEQYLPTRKFYESCGFKLEAVLKEYYDDKDDCYIYSYKFCEDDAADTVPAE